MTLPWNLRTRLILAFVVLLGTLHVCGFARPFQTAGEPVQYIVNDDSMITLRVAANIAARQGPYFNAGERTAANTSLFWPYAMSPVFRSGLDRGRCVLAVSILSSLMCAMTLALVVFYATSVPLAVATAGTLLCLPFVREYGASAWEHVPQMLLVTLAYLVLLGRVRWVGTYRYAACLGLLSLAFCARPDTLPMFLPMAALVLWRRQEEGQRGALLALAFAAVVVCGYFLLHRHLYGQFVPNTFYLKVNPGAGAVGLGLRYLQRSVWESGIPLFLLGAAWLVLVRRSRSSAAEQTLAVTLVLQVLYIVSVGGDVFFYGRFFLMMAPITVLLFWEKCGQLWSLRGTTAVAAVCIVGVATANLHAMLLDVEASPVHYLRGYIASGGEMGADMAVLAPYLRSHLAPRDGEVGLSFLGALSFYLPEYRVADFLGKADAVVAHEPVKWGPVGHNKWDILHTLRDRHVAVVPLSPIPADVAQEMVDKRFPFAVNAALEVEPYTREHYTYRSGEQLGLPGSYGLLIRNDLLWKFPVVADAPGR